MSDAVVLAVFLIACGVWSIWGMGYALLAAGGALLAWCVLRGVLMAIAGIMAARKLPRE